MRKHLRRGAEGGQHGPVQLRVVEAGRPPAEGDEGGEARGGSERLPVDARIDQETRGGLEERDHAEFGDEVAREPADEVAAGVAGGNAAGGRQGGQERLAGRPGAGRTVGDEGVEEPEFIQAVADEDRTKPGLGRFRSVPVEPQRDPAASALLRQPGQEVGTGVASIQRDGAGAVRGAGGSPGSPFVQSGGAGRDEGRRLQAEVMLLSGR